MPQILENCVSQLKAQWKKDPKSRPIPKDPKQDVESQAFAICTARLKKAGKLSNTEYALLLAESGDGDMAGRIALLEDLGHERQDAARMALSDRESGRAKVNGYGPALVGLTLTIKPFIKRQEMATVIEAEDGSETLRIPLMRKGAWRHPVYGVLKFDDNFFSSLTTNFERDVVGQQIPIKGLGHKPAEQEAVGWVKNLELDGDSFVVYGEPTGERGVDLVKSKKMPYASAEFVFDYRDSELRTLSFEGLEEIEDEDEGVYEFSQAELDYIDEIESREQEGNMPDKTEDVRTISLEEYEQLQTRLQTLEEMENRFVTLQAQLEDRDERIAELENVNEAAMVAAIVERARNYRDSEGRGHSAVFLNAIEAALTMSEINHGDEVVVQLSDEEVGVDTVRSYFRDFVRYLADNLPGTVPMDGATEGEDVRELESEDVDENLGADLWED